MDWLLIAAFTWWMAAVLFHLGGVFACYRMYTTKNQETPADEPVARTGPKVTILRPLKGLDCNIESNLDSTFLQDYPLSHYEIIMSVADPTDPVIPLANAFLRRYPGHSARLIIGDVKVGANPKINNLIRGYTSAKHDIVWILDSNIWVCPGTLRRSAFALQANKVGLVHHLPVAVNATSLGSRLEMLFLNSVHARAYLAINRVGPSSCVIGKSILFRRSDLGPLDTFGKYMAEDNMIGQAIWDLGLTHVLTNDRAWQPLGHMRARDYFTRRHRWGRIRKYTVTLAMVIEPMTECGVQSFLFAYMASPYAPFLAMYALHACVWMGMDFCVGRLVAHTHAMSLPMFVVPWVVRELTCLPVYLWAMAGSTVSWRTFQYRILDGGTVQLVDRHTPPSSWALVVSLVEFVSRLVPPTFAWRPSLWKHKIYQWAQPYFYTSPPSVPKHSSKPNFMLISASPYVTELPVLSSFNTATRIASGI